MKIAIIDSGINANDPHVRSIAGGIGVTPDGLEEDFRDRLGHGTTVAAIIREKVPLADLFAVKVCDRRLFAGIGVLSAMDWCRYHQMDLVNLTAELEDQEACADLGTAIEGLLMVSAVNQFRGSLPGVISVDSDEACPRDEFHYRKGIFYASPYPRPVIGGGVQSRTTRGIGYAVANMTGFVARTLPSIRASRVLSGGSWHASIAALRDTLVWELASIGTSGSAAVPD